MQRFRTINSAALVSVTRGYGPQFQHFWPSQCSAGITQDIIRTKQGRDTVGELDKSQQLVFLNSIIPYRTQACRSVLVDLAQYIECF